MDGKAQFDPEHNVFTMPNGPKIEEVRESTYTHGELHALLAPVLGVPAEDIKGLAVVVDLGDRLTMGGTPSTTHAQLLIIRALESGILGFIDVS